MKALNLVFSTCSSYCRVLVLRRLHVLILQVAENLDMTAYMCVFLLERILPSLAQAAPNFSQASLATSRTMMQSGPFPSVNPTRHLSDKFLDQDFELNSLNEQIRKYDLSLPRNLSLRYSNKLL